MPAESLTSGQEALIGAVLLFVGLGLVPLAVAAARHFYPARVVFFARWGFSHAMLSLLGALVLQQLVVLLLLDEDSGFTETLTAGFAWQASVAILVGALAWRAHPDVPEALGFERRHALRAVGTGLLVLVMLLPGIFGLGMLWPWMVDALGGTYAPQDVLVGFAELTGGELAWAIVLAVVLVPLTEEILFRGWLQPLLCQNLGEVGGIVLTSTLFAAMHGESAFLPIFALSWVLGAVMMRSHRLWAPWAMHAAFNAINLGLFLALPGSRDLLT